MNRQVNCRGMIIFLFLICAVTVFGGDIDTAVFKPVSDDTQFRSQLKQMAAKMLTIDSDFTQEKHLSMLEEKITSKGHFSFKKENRVRWHYLTPINYLIIINGDKITIKDETKVSSYDMKSNKIFNEINTLNVGCLQGDILENKDDFTLNLSESEHYVKAELVPRSDKMEEFVSTIVLYFDKENFTVVRMLMTEQSEDYTLINFYNKNINKDISDETFIIK